MRNFVPATFLLLVLALTLMALIKFNSHEPVSTPPASSLLGEVEINFVEELDGEIIKPRSKASKP